MALPPEPAGLLAVDLCYPEPPAIDARALAMLVRSNLPGTALVWSGPSNLLLRHDRADPDTSGRLDPAEILGLPPEARPLTAHSPDGHLVHAVWLGVEPTPPDDRDLSQSWSWPDAHAALSRCRYQLTVVQLLGAKRNVGERVSSFRGTLHGLITLARPLATWWPGSQQALPPGALVAHPLSGLVNVRLFRSVNDPNVTITDTLGMHALGLPDLQCRSRGLPTERLGDLLFELAEYLFRHGNPFRNGRPVPGLAANQQFVPHPTISTVTPPRPIIDLDPGRQYSG